jgi:co-chaperonin GroES (HSP10)
MSNVAKLKPKVNLSGIVPAGHRVLVKADEYMKSYSGIIEIPQDVKDRSQNAQTTGTVIALGSTAYAQREFGNGVAWCAPGDRVMFARYGGIQVKGKDKKTYRILTDEDIFALVDEEVSFDLDSTY